MLVDYTEYRYLITVNISLSYGNFHEWLAWFWRYYVNDIKYISKDLVVDVMNLVYENFLNDVSNRYNTTFQSSLPNEFSSEDNNRWYIKRIYSQYGGYVGDVTVVITEFSQIQNYFNN